MTSARPDRSLLIALAVLGAAALAVLGLLAGAALTRSATPAAVPDDASVDAGFARDMQVHHGQAVEMSVLVRDRSDDPDVRGLALDILLTQQNQQGQMAGWLQTWGLGQSSAQPIMGWMSTFGEGMDGMDMGEETTQPVPTPENPMTTMGLATDVEMDALAAADSVTAERIYLQLMTDHHLGGVEMASAAAAAATQPQVRRLAEAMVAGQTAELALLEELLDARGGPVDL